MYTLIVPSLAETACTGFKLGAKKSIYRQEWEIRIMQESFECGTKLEAKAYVFKNGKPVPNYTADLKTNKSFIKFWNAFISFYNSSEAMK